MKIATWNVNSIRVRKDRVWPWLAAHDPDIVCLQETKVVDADFPADEAQKLGYHVAVHGQKSYNGVAILAKRELEEVVAGFGDGQDDPDARLIAATVAGVRVITAYVPNGRAVGTEAYQGKLAWMKRLGRYLERSCAGHAEVALCGDFNVAPDDRDVYDPLAWKGKIMCSDAERAALAELVSCGVADAFRKHHSEGGLYTWWDYRQLAFAKKRGLRIDHIYLSPKLLDRCTAASIDRDARKGKLPSDHAPMLVTLASATSPGS